MKIRTLLIVLSLAWLIGCSVSPSNTQIPVPAARSTRIAAPTLSVSILPKENRPNIIFILVDDLDSKLGTINYLPNLQKLMIEQGLSLNSFFISDTTCCPSRTTILRGQYTHNHQVYTSDILEGFQKFYELGHDSSTIATWLQAAGYRTILLGKYLNGYPIGADHNYVPQGWNEWYSPVRGKPYTGSNYTLNENGALVSYGANPEDYLLDVLSSKMERFISSSQTDYRPFFMYIAPYQPHQPATPSPKYANLFEGLQTPRTDSFNEADVQDKPSTIRYDPPLSADAIWDLDNLYRRRVQSMQSVDEMISRLFAVLERTHQLQNTYIIFTSDNGFHLGQHRLLAGKGTAYEEDINVPFVIYGPGIPVNKVVNGYLAGNVDIAPTIAELAGVVPPPLMDGRSLLPLFRATLPDISNWRQAYLLEFYRESDKEASSLQFVNFQSPDGILEPPDLDELYSREPSLTYHGLRTKDYLYVEYSDGFVELYNLRNDPFEMDNIADKSDPGLLAALSARLKELYACQGNACRKVESEPLP